MCIVGEAADETISKHLLTLGSNDYMSVISYDASISTSLDGKGVLQEPYRLWRATDSNMVAANEEGRRRRPVGMNAAFHIAFNMTGEPSVDSLDKVGQEIELTDARYCSCDLILARFLNRTPLQQ